MKFINYDNIIEKLTHCAYASRKVETWEDIIAIINEIPAVDAVIVVRCKDCVYHRELNQSEKEYYNENALICTNSYFLESTVVESDDFCHYGKR